MGLFKRDKVWWMRFTHNGKQVRRSTETTNKKQAEKIHAKVITQIAEGKWFGTDEGEIRTFAELAEKYEAQELCKLKSRQTISSHVKNLKEFFGPYPLNKINPALIDDFKQMRKATVKPATINRQMNTFRRMLNLAKKRWLWLKEVPVVEMEPNADNMRVRHLSFDEFLWFHECCKDWLKDLVYIAAWTGLRQGNILNLKRDQVSLVARTITIEGGSMKNGEHLAIPLAEPAYEVLKKALQIVRIDSPYVFCKSDGSRYHSMAVSRAVNKATEKAGIEDFRFHDLRHCYATWSRQAGVDLDTLADLLGHKDTRMTRRYAHITPTHLRSAVGLLEASYANSSTILAQSKKKEATENP